MPKKLIEINKFHTGIKSTPSQTDIEIDAARYSLNIDPIATQGRLQGIDRDRPLTGTGWGQQSFIPEHITQVLLNYRGMDVTANNTSLDNRYMNYGSGIVHFGGLQHSQGATVSAMYDGILSHTSAIDNINNATEFAFSSVGTEAGYAFNAGARQSFFLFDDDNVFQNILDVSEQYLSEDTVTRYIFENSDKIIRQNGEDVSSGRRLYPRNLSWAPGGALMFQINDKFIYFYLVDTDSPEYHYDPITYLSAPGGGDDSSQSWQAGFAGAYPIEIDFNKNRTCDTLNTNIRNIIFAGIRTVLLSSEWNHIFDSVTHVKTAYLESLTIIPKATKLHNFQFVYNLFGRVDNAPFQFSGIGDTGNHLGLEIIIQSDYFNQIYPNPNSDIPLPVDLRQFKTVPDKISKDRLNLIGLSSGDASDSTSAIHLIKDIYNYDAVQVEELSITPSSGNEYDLLDDDDKVHVALGPGSGNRPKVVMTPDDNPLTSNINENILGVYASALDPPIHNDLSGMFTYILTPPIHGINAASMDGVSNFNLVTCISHNDTLSTSGDGTASSKYGQHFFPDYDVILDSTPGVSLYTALQTGSGKTIAGLKIGQIFCTASTTDFTDGAMVAWKKYDYSAVETAVVATELYMFCGYYGNNIPILRFLGIQEAIAGGTPAFAYAIKKSDRSIYKISLKSDENLDDDVLFDGTTTDTVADADGTSITITNVGSRITSLNLSTVGLTGYVSAIYSATSPTLFNRIGLAGEGEDYLSSFEGSYRQNVYWDNGHLKILYRHGVFWIADSELSTQLFRVNAIDFHELGGQVSMEPIGLDFGNIPSQLHAEGGQGIIRRTVEDQHREKWSSPDGNGELCDEFDPKSQSGIWNRIPQGAEIIGICETWESGPIDNRPEQNSVALTPEDITVNDRVFYKFKACRFKPSSGVFNTEDLVEEPIYQATTLLNGELSATDTDTWLNFGHPQWRLTTGDVVRFAGLSATSKAFNTGPPRTVNVVDDGYAILVEGNDNDVANSPYFLPFNNQLTDGMNQQNSNYNDHIWFNCKVWILYGKKDADGFDDWDLFLYNANTIDIDNVAMSIPMADRTVPFTQARWHETGIIDNDAEGNFDAVDYGGGYNNASFSKRMHYPGDAAFLHKGHGAPDSKKGMNSPVFDDSNEEFEDWGALAPERKTEGLLDDESMILNACADISNNDSWVAKWEEVFSHANVFDSIFETAQSWSVFGIYDKAGRWTNNGDSDHKIFGNRGDDLVRNRSRYFLKESDGTNTGGYSIPGFGWYGIDTKFGSPLYWGNNIGWEVEPGVKARTIKNISGSLHPKNPYSTLYNGNRIYVQRVNSGLGDNNFATIQEASVMPTHAVTFLSKVGGTFIVSPGKISRKDPGATGGITVDDPSSGDVLGYGIYRYLTQFVVGGEGAAEYFAGQHYDDELTLFTIDDFSGHRGSVMYGTSKVDADGASQTVNPMDLDASGENFYVSGISMGRPNIGGPEIENPFYFRKTLEASGESGTRWPFSSLNGGFSNPGEGHNTDGGWDGYEPPRLGFPGKGYYVYINRRWKCQNLTNQLNEDFNAGPIYAGQNSHANQEMNLCNGHVWNFQQNKGADNDSFFHSNRRHNFSLTCIGDNVISNLGAYTNFSWPTNRANLAIADDPATHSYFDLDYDLDHSLWGKNIAEYYGYPDELTSENTVQYRSKVTRFSFWDEDINHNNEKRLMTTFSCNELPMAVCTMHRIKSGIIGEINNCFQAIFKSNRGYINMAYNTDFNVSYVCGFNSNEVNPKSGIAIIRTNQDANFRNMLCSLNHPTDGALGDSRFIHGWHNEMRPVHATMKWNNINGTFADGQHYNYLFASIAQNAFLIADTTSDSMFATTTVGTHILETIPLTNEKTFFVPDVGTEINLLQMRQVATKVYTDTVIGEGLRVFTLNPMTPEYPNYQTAAEYTDSDTHVGQVFSGNGQETFLGKRDLNFKLDHGVDDSDNDDVTYPTTGHYQRDEPFDSGGKFNPGDFFENEDDEDIWSSAISFISTIVPEAILGGALTSGYYFYKIAFEYDGAYESPLPQKDSCIQRLLDVDDTFGYENIQINLQLGINILQNISPRVTGISVYRRHDGMDDDNYYHLENIKFADDRWSWKSSTLSWTLAIFDKGSVGPSYSALNGIDQTIVDTSMNYGLMTRHQGYLYVSQVSHSMLENVRRYIFRSQPNNFFAFDWSNDFVILPEVPIAMTSFNSRLYVWGKKKLYKIDPFSLIIEEEYEGISIAGKDAYVKTEYGLCFMDKNNIYIHDGNRPNPIGDPILYASEKLVGYETHPTATDGYVLIQQGYRELIKQTLDNGDNPTIFYLGRKNSFVVNLSDKARKGKGFVFNLTAKRWDLWNAPRPKSVGTGQDSDILINDGSILWNYIDAESILYTKYLRRLWTWVSKDLTFGVNTQDKIFRGLTFLGTPSIFNFSSNAVSEHSSDGSVTNAIQAFVDDEPVNLTIKNNFYEITNLGDTYLTETIDDSVSYLKIATSLDVLDIDAGVTTGVKTQKFIRPGQLIKLDDEIVLVTAIADYEDYMELTVRRAQMGTTAASHTGAVTTNHVAIVSPQLKFDSGTKGKKLSVRLFEQAGYIDSIAISYKQKGVKL